MLVCVFGCLLVGCVLVGVCGHGMREACALHGMGTEWAQHEYGMVTLWTRHEEGYIHGMAGERHVYGMLGVDRR